MTMLLNVETLRKAFWKYRQPLTQIPDTAAAPVSDLFIWRNSAEWKTFFELTDIAGLFDETVGAASRFATVFFFDANGEKFSEKKFALPSNQRQTLDLSHFIAEEKGNIGTFSVFHAHAPAHVTQLGSFIAERGYVGYVFQQAPLRSYVHGNLDAVAFRPDNTVQLLGSGSWRQRDYRLQHVLSGPAHYEIGLVNPSPRQQNVYFQISTLSGEEVKTMEARLNPKEVQLVPIQIDAECPLKLVIKSRLVMARPLVFRMNGQTMDVFHG